MKSTRTYSWLLPSVVCVQLIMIRSSSVTFANPKVEEGGIASAAQLVRFLKSVPPRATLKQIQKLLPPETVLHRPEFIYGEAGRGNFFVMHGPMNGVLQFLNSTQDRLTAHGWGQDLNAHDPRLIYKASDPINRLELRETALAKNGILADTKAYVAGLSRILGKPKKTGVEQPGDVDDESAGGTYAIWRLEDKRTIRYHATTGIRDHTYVHNLGLEFPYTKP